MNDKDDLIGDGYQLPYEAALLGAQTLLALDMCLASCGMKHVAALCTLGLSKLRSISRRSASRCCTLRIAWAHDGRPLVRRSGFFIVLPPLGRERTLSPARFV
jgi:hypothetical protein